MARDNDQMFDRGQTWYGPDQSIDANDLAAAHLEGTEKTFEDLDYSSGPGAKAYRTGKPVRCRVVRNDSGITLHAKQMVLLDAARTRITGLANNTSQDGYPLDEWVGSSGVRAGDLCYVVMSGPAMMLTPLTGAAFNGDIAAGTRLNSVTASNGTTAGGTTTPPGRVSQFTAVAATTAGQFTDILNFTANFVGTAISARTTAETNSDILVDCRYRY
jgi:hypothetical protein